MKDVIYTGVGLLLVKINDYGKHELIGTVSSNSFYFKDGITTESLDSILVVTKDDRVIRVNARGAKLAYDSGADFSAEFRFTTDVEEYFAKKREAFRIVY